MHAYFCYILLLHYFRLCECATLDELYEYVTNYKEYIKSYTPPRNNQELLETCNSTLHDYGEYDFIIVGGGSAGSVLANRLSEIENWKILLLEAGGNQNNFSDIPAFAGEVTHSSMDWGYHTKPQKNCCQGMVNRQCKYQRGKVLGGSGVVNALAYSRGDRDDYDSWAKMGNEGWSYDEILPYFKKSERIQIGDYDRGYHGTQGLLQVNHTAPSILADYTLGACEELGLKQVDYNGKQLQGVSRFQYTINFNKRDNGAHAFLDPIMNSRANLKVLLNAFVIKIVLESSYARGVEFVKDHRRFVARAKKEVILSAGSINSPQLLMLSGIGPENELTKHKIPVKNDLPVGRKMKDHPQFLNFIIRCNKTVPKRTLKENLERYVSGETPLTNAFGNDNVAFFNTQKPGSGLPNVELVISVPPFGIPDRLFFNFDEDVGNVFQSYDPQTDFGIPAVVLKPKSIGSVTLQSKSPLDFPLIDPNYFSDPNNEDMETMYQGIKFVEKLLKTKSLRAINATFVGNQLGCEDLKKNRSDREYWYCAIRRFTSPIYHPVSTTRMGLDPKDSVVDNHCIVHRMKNLRVVDAGVMPDTIRGHVNAPTFMIAEKISDDIKRHHNEI